MSYPSSPLSPYLGALELQFAPSPFYTFVDLSLMVLYQLESLHLDDYNLIYSQNKNMGLDKILTAFHLKTQHFPFLQTLLQTNPNIKTHHGIHQKQLQKWFRINIKTPSLPKLGLFPKIKITKDEARVLFSYLSLFKSPLLSCLITKEQEVGRNPT